MHGLHSDRGGGGVMYNDITKVKNNVINVNTSVNTSQK